MDMAMYGGQMLVDLKVGKDRIPFVQPPTLPLILRLARRRGHKGEDSLTTAHSLLIQARDDGNHRLSLDDDDRRLFSGLRRHTISPDAVFLNFGGLNHGFLIVWRNRVLPFVLSSVSGHTEVTQALAGMLPAFQAIAEAPWVLAPEDLPNGPWPVNAIAPGWLPVRSTPTPNDADQDLVDLLMGFAFAHGLHQGRVYLVGAHFTKTGRYVPPRFGYSAGRKRPNPADPPIVVDGFDVHRAHTDAFPYVHQAGFESGVLDNVVMDDVDFTAHQRMSAVSTFRACIRTSPSVESP